MPEELFTTDQADDIMDASTPTWILKHSTACPVSAWGRQQLTRYLQEHPDEPAAVVVVQQARDVSNHIAKRLGVRHETPQVLLVQNGRVLWHISHGGITPEMLHEARHHLVKPGTS